MSEKQMGINLVIEVNKGTPASPTWVMVGGQKDGKLNRKYDTIDTTTKDSEGSKEYEYGFFEWEIDCNGLLPVDDEGYKLLEQKFIAKEKVQVRMNSKTGNKYSGLALLVDFPVDAAYSDSVKYSVKLKGTGKLNIEPIAPVTKA